MHMKSCVCVHAYEFVLRDSQTTPPLCEHSCSFCKTAAVSAFPWNNDCVSFRALQLCFCSFSSGMFACWRCLVMRVFPVASIHFSALVGSAQRLIHADDFSRPNFGTGCKFREEVEARAWGRPRSLRVAMSHHRHYAEVVSWTYVFVVMLMLSGGVPL